MTEINWNIFKIKFNEKEQSAFERLSYLLFCSEHGIKKGLFGFKNQIGIETEPVLHNEKYIGFQSKYYDSSLANHKIDIIDSLKKAKRENPLLDTIFLYTNQTPSESNKKGVKLPKYLSEIAEIADTVGVNLEWRLPSHFTQQLSLVDNQQIAQHFFSLDQSIVEFTEDLRQHAENILLPIQSSISYGQKQIKIERIDTVKQIEQSDASIQILAGTGGSGKTAVIKDFFKNATSPVYLFKAAEFNINCASLLFRKFGNFNLKDFIEIHETEQTKVMVIDSAEKLSDLDDQTAFLEILSSLISSKWRIIFTTRYSYLEDLKFQFVEVYRLPFSVTVINELDPEELVKIAEENGFTLPSDSKLRTLIRNLFYLNEYLSIAMVEGEISDLTRFKQTLWQKKIQHSSFRKDQIHLQREETFLKLAKLRCETGRFYISGKDLNQTALSHLANDEIIYYDNMQNAFFIAHDIYEEWALERIIEQAYLDRDAHQIFFDKIGQSLAIRRAFRNWISSKLQSDVAQIKSFVTSIFQDETIVGFWKDEVLISTMLSEYSGEFFDFFSEELLKDNKSSLIRLIFLLRTACKAIDPAYTTLLNLQQNSSGAGTYLITTPKGKGWEHAIDFLFNNVAKFNLSELPVILPLLWDWVTDHRTGLSTKKAAQFGLYFYEKYHDEESYARKNDQTLKHLIRIILFGSAEIKQQLQIIVNGLLSSSLNNRHDRYQDILDKILTAQDGGVHMVNSMPESVVQLTNKYWYQPVSERHPFDHGGYGTEQYYLIPSRWHHEYSPASAFQTPVYWILKSDLMAGVRFILDFTKRAVEAYSASEFEDESLKEITVLLEGDKVYKQYISNCLWNMYRGSGSPVAPCMMQSYHMALEKRLLELAKSQDPQVLSGWLWYLLKNSSSASISAIVCSVVLAHPDDYFEIALAMFRNYDFIIHDRWRKGEEHQAKRIYSIGRGMNPKSKIYEDERISTCEDAHRRRSLDDLILNYQFFRNEGVSDEVFDQRQQQIWSTIDEYYQRLKNKELDNYDEESVKLFLASIDRRNMNPSVEDAGDKLIVKFNPKIEPELIEYQNTIAEDSDNLFSYASLKLWASNKLETYIHDTQYPQYEGNPAEALQQVKNLVNDLEDSNEQFWLMNHTIPAFVCCVLVREYVEHIAIEDLQYCKKIILEFAYAPLNEDYRYQISDGVEASVGTLPYLYGLFPAEQSNFDLTLLCLLFDTNSIGNYKRICDYAIEAINGKLSSTSPENALRIFRAYLAFGNKYNLCLEEMREKNRQSYGYGISRSQILDYFLDKHNLDVQAFFNDQYNFPELKEYTDINLLETAFHLVPNDTLEPSYLEFTKKCLPLFSTMLVDDRFSGTEEPKDYMIRLRLFKKLAYFVLHRKIEEIPQYVHPFVDNFVVSEESDKFLQEFIGAEDILRTYDPFWKVWDCFYEEIVSASSRGRVFKSDAVISTYLLAWPWWKETAKSWFSLKDRERRFYLKAVKDMGHHPAVLYSIAKLVNEIAGDFIDDAVVWASNLIESNHNLSTDQLVTNTTYYLEIMVRKFVYLNRTTLKLNPSVRKKVLVVLAFLINKGSENAYLLREDIL
ncbi:AVAST type 4 anti-phage nuclease Avs4 [Pedobacter hiemivivus]|uniref:ATP-binding protein n=1 Tax=Pedobacter hiemivivus TaxID=2530454 RepID=A0A4R0NFI7_9SPHI|nr:AVAST type 4 anti-phage nuclease Avs4 [Pedobacter hiemivivus]TCC98507.1 ATP-binding protein [Pedobacter hiemivivus]